MAKWYQDCVSFLFIILTCEGKWAKSHMLTCRGSRPFNGDLEVDRDLEGHEIHRHLCVR